MTLKNVCENAAQTQRILSRFDDYTRLLIFLMMSLVESSHYLPRPTIVLQFLTSFYNLVLYLCTYIS